MNNTRLHIEKHGSCSGVDIFHIRGLNEEETQRIMNATSEGKEKAGVLAAILDTRENDYRPGRLGTAWLCGHGIYSVRPWKDRLLVEVGSSCD